MAIIIIPCINCITLGVCRYKTLERLIYDCQIVRDFLNCQINTDVYPPPQSSFISQGEYYRAQNYNVVRLDLLYEYLKPPRWSLNYEVGNIPEGIEAVPCDGCLVYIRCKNRMLENESHAQAITYIADRENCPQLRNYIQHADQDKMNKARLVFGLEPMK